MAVYLAGDFLLVYTSRIQSQYICPLSKQTFFIISLSLNMLIFIINICRCLVEDECQPLTHKLRHCTCKIHKSRLFEILPNDSQVLRDLSTCIAVSNSGTSKGEYADAENYKMARSFSSQASEENNVEAETAPQAQQPRRGPVPPPIDPLQLHSSSPKKRIDALIKLRESIQRIGRSTQPSR